MSNKNLNIYLAIPYSHKDPRVMEYRFNVSNLVSAFLMRDGYRVFSPISMSHPIHVEGKAYDVHLSEKFDFWKELDFSIIKKWADEVFVINIKGTEESIGVQSEIEYGQKLDKPVTDVFVLNEKEYRLVPRR